MIAVNKDINNYIQRVSFTPAFYSRAYQSYKNGSHRELIAMMKEAATDSLVSGCIQGRAAGFMRDLQIKPFDPDNTQDQERADFYKEVFSGLRTRSLFKAIMQARAYKFSVIDFEWDMIEGRQVPVRFKFFDQKYFGYDPQDDVLKIDRNNSYEDIPPDALVCESEDTPYMLPVLRDYILKEFGLEAWASFLENWGEPLVIGYYPPGSSPDVKEAVDSAVNTIAGSSRGSAPKGSEIDIKESGRGSGDHKEFLKDACNKGIAISILGHANAVEQSTAQIGQNDAPFKPMQFISIDDLYYIDEQIDALVKNIHNRNFGDQRYPSCVTAKPDQIGMKERRENLRLAYNMGFLIHPDDIRKLGVQIDPEEEPQRKQDPFNFT